MTKEEKLNELARELRPSIQDAVGGPYGDKFIEILCHVAVRRPEVWRGLVDALRMQGHWLEAEAAGLDGLQQLRAIMDKESKIG